MCGIAGAAWTADGEPLSAEVLRRMTDSIRHRGPDDDGFYFDPPPGQGGPGAALGHRRLSIIDLAGGHQPLSNEDGTIWIVFNGEIFNYRELRPPLEAQGHVFSTVSDTETIVHLYEQYGEKCVDHLRGQFAFAIWDERRKRLFIARDRLGQKPVYYRLEPHRFAFASELKAILQIPGLPREIDPLAVDEYLTYQYVPHPRCILKGFHKLPPAHWASYERGQLTIERYWAPPYSDPPESNGSARSPQEWSEALRATLTEAVRLRLRSDVPLGAFLSGGVDSTIISGLMQELSEQRIHTFSIGFPVKAYDETTYAREAAAHLKTDHHEWIVEPKALEILPQLIWQYDEPFSDSSAIPTMYLSRMTRQHVTVALSGDGGDELFAGYDRYRAVQVGMLFDRLPRPLRSVLTARLWQKIPASVRQRSRRRRVKRLLDAFGREPERRYLRWISIFDDDRRRAMYTPEFERSLGGADSADFLLAAYNHCRSRDFVTRTTCADVLTYLPCDILKKVDIASMSYALEARSPFLDHHVAELAARMPIELKRNRRGGKRILIETFADLLPPSIQSRPKMGFGVPLDHWFRHDLKPMLYDVLLSEQSLSRGWFRPDAVRKLVDEHMKSHWDHNARLWSLLCFELWQRTFVDQPTPALAH